MKRTVLAVALYAAFASSAFAAVSPAANPSVAFDQVDIIALGTYGSTPNDFTRDYAGINVPPSDGNVPTLVMPTKTLKRFAFFKGQSRVETPALHSIIISRPGEVDILDTAKKTYRKTVGDALKTLPIASGGLALPSMPQAGPGVAPGTMDLAFTLDGSAMDAQTIAGQLASGVRIAMSATSSNATGSCVTFAKFINVKGTVDSFYVARVEPVANAPGLPQSFMPQDLMKFPGLDPKGCAVDAFSMQMHHLASVVGLAGFYLYRKIVMAFDPSSGVPFSPTIVSERGNVRDLTDVDAALFTIPAGYTPAP